MHNYDYITSIWRLQFFAKKKRVLIEKFALWSEIVHDLNHQCDFRTYLHETMHNYDYITSIWRLQFFAKKKRVLIEKFATQRLLCFLFS